MRSAESLSTSLRGALAAVAVMVAAGPAHAGPHAVSPGGLETVSEAPDGCPTFSWSSSTGAAESFEIVVFEASEEEGAATPDGAPTLRVVLPGGASSWTPSARECLAAGKDYVWSLRATGGMQASAWSEGRRFRVAERPSQGQIEWALDVLSRELEWAAGQVVGEYGEIGPTGSAAPPGAAGADPQAGGSEALDIGGLIEATGLQAVAAGGASGDITAAGALRAASTYLVAPSLTMTRQGVVEDQVRLWSPASGALRESRPDPGLIDRYGGLQIRNLYTAAGIRAHTGASVVSASAISGWTGSGGGGVRSIPSVSSVRMDENDSTCYAGSVVVGVRFWDTDTDQLGLQVMCSTP